MRARGWKKRSASGAKGEVSGGGGSLAWARDPYPRLIAVIPIGMKSKCIIFQWKLRIALFANIVAPLLVLRKARLSSLSISTSYTISVRSSQIGDSREDDGGASFNYGRFEGRRRRSVVQLWVIRGKTTAERRSTMGESSEDDGGASFNYG